MDAIATAHQTMPENTLGQAGACRVHHRGTSSSRRAFRGLFAIAAIGACLTSTTLAGERSSEAAREQSPIPAHSKWKGHNISAYGDRFKAALQVQAQEALKPAWSWRDDERETTVAKKD